MEMRAILEKLARARHLTAGEMEGLMEAIMEGRATPAQMGAALMGLRAKGESVEEMAAAARVMRRHALRIPYVPPRGEPLLDTCGTGGDGSNTFNVSTAAALVAAAGGVKVAKHGNRSISSRSGSADCLEALGVAITLPPAQVARCIEEVGIGFLFAPSLHPAMRHAIGPRRELGIRTIFNLLGPLTNPAGATVQLMGVYDPALTGPVAQVLGRLGVERAWVVHGHGGMDELSLTGPTTVASLEDGKVEELTITPEEVGLSRCRPEELLGGDARRNGEIILEIFQGRSGPKADMVALNAGAALYLSGRAPDPAHGVEMAREIISQGRAMERLRALQELSQRLAREGKEAG